MPYEVRKQGDMYCVYNQQTGEKRACHDSMDKAHAQMRLLYGIESGSIKKELNSSDGVLVDVCACDACLALDDGLTEDGMTVKAVWTTAYINSLPDSAFAYIEPNCDTKGCRHFPIKGSDGKYDAAHVRNALARAPQSPFGSKAMPKIEAAARSMGIGGRDSGKSLVDTVKDWFNTKSVAGTASNSVTLTKQADGRTRVLLRVSNIFKDKHGEIITSEAHKEYEAYVKETGQYPEFWLWHTPGSKWGKADLVSFDDGFLSMSGLVDVGKEYVAEALAEQGSEIGVSHGFKTIKAVDDGLIEWYRTFEASPLPRDQAANIWTGMMLAKTEWKMGLAEKHKKFFEALHVPGEVIQEWDSQSKGLADILKEAGVEYKATEPEPEPEPEPTPDSGSEILAELKKINERIGGIETKQKDLEEKVKDSVASTMAAAIVPGAPVGFTASKQGEPPSAGETASVKQWEEELASLILGGAK